MIRTAIAVRHVAFEDAGVLEVLLPGLGFHLTYLEAGVDDLGAAADCGLLIVLGGPIGAYEDAAYPFLGAELALIGRRLRANQPTLGLCLGAQLMARALGAAVHPGPAKEIGWSPLTLTGAALAELDGVPVLHWHGDTFDLPPGAALAASTALTERQAFTIGRNILGLQFHAEVTGRNFERWLIGHACELAGAGISPVSLRADAALYAAGLEKAGSALFRRWIENLDWPLPAPRP